MKNIKCIGTLIMTLVLLVGCNSVNNKVEYIETLDEGQEIEGLVYENEDGTLGKIVKCTDDKINIRLYKWLNDESKPNGFEVIESDDEKTFTISTDVQVWVMVDGAILNKRIAYNDISNYEKEKGHSIIWGVNFDESGTITYIYEIYIP